MKSFNDVYQEIYNENYEELEKLRKSKSRKMLIITVVVLILIFLIVSSYFLSFKNNTFSMMTMLTPIIIFICFLMLIIGVTVNRQKYALLFKEKIISPFVKNIDENLTFNPKNGIGANLYRQGDFEWFDLYSSEDSISGKLDGKYALSMAEVHTQSESEDSEGHRTTYTIFHGIFGYIECAKDITTTLKIHSDKGLLGKVFKGKTKIEMDSSEFEEYFDVYGENKIIAMQILTSDVMDLMINFIRESKIQYELTIKNNSIYIRFHTGEVFEPKMLKKALDYNMLKKYYDIIDFVFKVSRAINEAIENTDI